jgi:tRNA pseudouridine38-40 synthase
MERQPSSRQARRHSAPADAVKLRLTVAFDGTNYAGWQVQKGNTGVQHVIEQALSGIFSGKHRLHSSSRTDTGVHALGMVAHVEIPRTKFKMPPRKLRLALNAHLPDDIRIVKVTRARSDFHARFDAKGKQYRYIVWNHPAMNPLLRTTAWHFPQRLDVNAIRQASALFLGKHDFQSFAGNRGYPYQDTVRTLSRCEVKRSGPQLTFIIEGNGFLYRMCRAMVGTLVQVGRGRFRPAEIREMLTHKDRRIAGMTAPAQGLILWKVLY